MKVHFEYGTARVGDLRVLTGAAGRNGLPQVAGLVFQGETIQPTPRFWKSFFSRFGVSENVFRYFSHREVFDRVSKQAKTDLFRYCIECGPKKSRKMLAATSPDRSLLTHGEAQMLVERYTGEEVGYDSGLVTSTHVPRSGDASCQVGSDQFKQRFVMEIPIDGYGAPKIHLALLRLLCTNGMIGYSRAFRSEISTGKDPSHGIVRALETFDNDEGYAALRQRFESSQKSWASIREVQELYRTLARLIDAHEINRDGVLADYYTATGRVHELYGLANLDALSIKRQRVLPAKCQVYDLINFASELASHHALPQGARKLQAYIGTLISDEFDMEGTSEQVHDFQDFFIQDAEHHVAASRS